MSTTRRAEIVGAGFAGLAAACALAQRGWNVRVHERAERLRTTGAGIYLYENGLRVLEALGAYAEAVEGAPVAHTREVRDDRNRVVSTHRWDSSSRVFSIVRQQVINALAAAAVRHGAEIVTSSEAIGATPEGELIFTTGGRLQADLIVAADGANSCLRDSLDLLAKRKPLADGAIRILIDKTFSVEAGVLTRLPGTRSDRHGQSSNTRYTADGFCDCSNVIATLCTGTPPAVLPSHLPLWACP